MPGKVNPVIPEVLNQVAFEVIGNDLTVTFAAEGGQLQLNAFEPIIAYSLFKSISHLREAILTLEKRCVVGITANRDKLRADVEIFDRPRHRAQSLYRLRHGDRDRDRGPRHRPRRLRTGAGAQADPAGNLAKILQPDQLTTPHGKTPIE